MGVVAFTEGPSVVSISTVGMPELDDCGGIIVELTDGNSVVGIGDVVVDVVGLAVVVVVDVDVVVDGLGGGGGVVVVVVVVVVVGLEVVVVVVVEVGLGVVVVVVLGLRVVVVVEVVVVGLRVVVVVGLRVVVVDVLDDDWKIIGFCCCDTNIVLLFTTALTLADTETPTSSYVLGSKSESVEDLS